MVGPARTGATALAKTEDCDGSDLIYLPEVSFDIDKFLKKVKELLKKKSSIVIAVSEGIKLEDGRYVCELGSVGDYVDAFGQRSFREPLPIWLTSWQQSAAARQEQWNYLLFREALPIWRPEWILTRPLW